MAKRDRHKIVEATAPIPWLSMVTVVVAGVSLIWLGRAGHTGLLEPFGDWGEVIAVALGVLTLVVFGAMVASRVLQGNAVLTGDGDGLLVIHPFGLSRVMRSVRLSGDLSDARLTTTRRPPQGRLRPAPVEVFTVTCGDRRIEISVVEGMVNEDYQQRFVRFLAWYQETRHKT